MSSKKPSVRELHLLLSFLRDASAQTSALARDQLKTLLDAYPDCRPVLLDVPDPELAYEARAFLEEARMNELLEAFAALAGQGDALDLEEGAYRLATLAYPALTAASIAKDLDALAESAEEAMDVEEAESVPQAGAVFRRFFFHDLGFHGNEAHYYDPDNSFLNRVLERRMGIPISLSAVYILVAQRLDLPVYGVGLPGHFIVAHAERGGPIYLDPFHQGRLLRKPDCIELVRQRGMRFQDSFLDPTPPRQILSRMIANLVTIYTEQGATERVQWLSKFLQTLQGDA